MTVDWLTHLLHQDRPYETPLRTECGKPIDHLRVDGEKWVPRSEMELVSCRSCDGVAFLEHVHETVGTEQLLDITDIRRLYLMADRSIELAAEIDRLRHPSQGDEVTLRHRLDVMVRVAAKIKAERDHGRALLQAVVSYDDANQSDLPLPLLASIRAAISRGGA